MGLGKITKCIHCGSEFHRQRKSHVFCSYQCYWEVKKTRSSWNKGNHSPRPNRKTGKTISCAKCGKSVYIRLSRRASAKYCSSECYKVAQKNTTIEVSLADAFVAAGLSFETHKRMFKRFLPDFVFEQHKLIVQADGDYWHSRPEVVERDNRFNRLALDDGWVVLRFPEHKIESDLNGCVTQVLLALK